MSDAWKRLEADAAAHFGVKRNLSRGMNYAILDTDFDVIKDLKWPNIIADTKYRDGSEGRLCHEMKDWAEETPDGFKPVLLVKSDTTLYQVFELSQFNSTLALEISVSFQLKQNTQTPLIPTNGWWPRGIVFRKGTNYLDNWFKKLHEVYIPLKTAQWDREFGNLKWGPWPFPIVIIRTPGVRRTVLITEMPQ